MSNDTRNALACMLTCWQHKCTCLQMFFQALGAGDVQGEPHHGLRHGTDAGLTIALWAGVRHGRCLGTYTSPLKCMSEKKHKKDCWHTGHGG